MAGDGSLWAATANGVVRWDLDTQTPTVYTTEHGLPSEGAVFVEAGLDGTVWAGGDVWMARFDGALTTFSVPNDYPLYQIAVGPDGTVWAAFEPGRLGRFDGSEWQMLDAPSFAEPQGEWVSDACCCSRRDLVGWAPRRIHGRPGIVRREPRRCELRRISVDAPHHCRRAPAASGQPHCRCAGRDGLGRISWIDRVRRLFGLRRGSGQLRRNSLDGLHRGRRASIERCGRGDRCRRIGMGHQRFRRRCLPL